MLDAPGGDKEATDRLRTMTRVITQSPALLARERQVFDDYARTLTALPAEVTGAEAHDVVPRVVANAMLGVHRALIDHVRELALAGEPAGRIRDSVRDQAERGFAQLEHGLGDFGRADR